MLGELRENSEPHFPLFAGGELDSLIKMYTKLGVVAHAESQHSGSRGKWVSEFEASLGYRVRQAIKLHTKAGLPILLLILMRRKVLFFCWPNY